MKVTKAQLKQTIQEEIRVALKETEGASMETAQRYAQDIWIPNLEKASSLIDPESEAKKLIDQVLDSFGWLGLK